MWQGFGSGGTAGVVSVEGGQGLLRDGHGQFQLVPARSNGPTQPLSLVQNVFKAENLF